jgi:hypothetical protein
MPGALDTLAPDPVVLFKDGVDSSRVSGHSLAVLHALLRTSGHSLAVLHALLRTSGNSRCVVTRATATPEEQASVMYELIERHGGMDGGVTYARGLWLAPGQHVIDTYVFWHGYSWAECVEAMAATIHAVGPKKVSHHCGDPARLGVVDVAPSSLAHPDAFLAAAKRLALPGGPIAKVLDPEHNDPTYHIEIPQPAALAVA